MPQTREEKAAYVQRLFGSIARRYDLMNDLMTLGMHRRWRAHAVSLAGTLERGGWGLDLCCGSGDFLKLMLRVTRGEGHFVGVDFSEEMLALARRRFSAEIEKGTVELFLADVSDLSFLPASQFDLVTCGLGLRNVADLSKTLLQARRRLRPGKALGSLDLTRPAPLPLRPVVSVYLRWIIPLLARLVVGAPGQYLWLHESRLRFPTRGDLAGLMEEVGYERLRVVSYAFGVVAAHIGYAGDELR